jgi:hypothetical protein
VTSGPWPVVSRVQELISAAKASVNAARMAPFAALRLLRAGSELKSCPSDLCMFSAFCCLLKRAKAGGGAAAVAVGLGRFAG